MSLLLPLGLLGLIGIAVLLLIYIIKPNYQQKFISSTYIWKLSLKYRKKNIPISKLRNILMIICQVLILALCALLLARPVTGGAAEPVAGESVAIIDASASMRVQNSDDVTRFERAISGVRELARQTAEKNGFLTVISAGKTAEVLASRVSAADMNTVYDLLDGMSDRGAGDCSFGSADIDGAYELAGNVLDENPEAEVVFFTATSYAVTTGTRVVNVAEEGEWNAAILNCTATIVENYYDISVDVGCYGKSENITVTCTVFNPNGKPNTSVTMYKSEYFAYGQEEITFVFGADDQIGALGSVGRLYSFDYVQVSIDVSDSFENDNWYYVYGGDKESIKIQYSTSDVENPFFRLAFFTLRTQMKNRWNVEYIEVNPSEAQTEGFDLYVFEHRMPSVMPSDGAVFLVNPDTMPAGAGITLGNSVTVNRLTQLAPGETSPITRTVHAENITVSRYTQIVNHDGYSELMYCQGDPILLLKDTPEKKYLVLSADIHRSNIAIIYEFPMIIKNLFEHFIPFTFRETPSEEAEASQEPTYAYSYHVDDRITLTPRDTVLQMNVDDMAGGVADYEYTEFPTVVDLTVPGVYTFTQNSLRVQGIKERLYVSVSAAESNITKVADGLPRLDRYKDDEFDYNDLVVIFAAILVGLLFAEWILQAREYFK